MVAGNKQQKAEDDIGAKQEKGSVMQRDMGGSLRLWAIHRAVVHRLNLTETQSSGPAKVFWVMSRMHRRTAPDSSLQAPGPDRCKHSLTAHRGTVPGCPHLAHKQPRRPNCGPGDRQHRSWLEAKRGREGGQWGGGEQGSMRK